MYRFIIDRVMISNGVCQSAAQPISTSSPQGAQTVARGKTLTRHQAVQLLGCEVHWHAAGHLHRRNAWYVVRNKRNSPRTFVRPIPAKMPANRTAAVNFYVCFQCVAKIFSRKPESNQWLKLLLLLVFFPWCPWPAIAYSRNHLNLRSFYPSIAADAS